MWKTAPLFLAACAASPDPATESAEHSTQATEQASHPTALSAGDEEVLDALTPLGREAFDRLLAARRFTGSAIYDGGITPNEVIALRLLWKEEPKTANAAFELLLARATLPGQLFALCGLYYTAPERFRAAIEPFRGRTETLAYQDGCIGFNDYPLDRLIEIDRPGAVRLAPGENIRSWLARHDNPNGTAGGYWCDIFGGAIPNDFREEGGFAEVRDESFDPLRD